MRFSHLDVALKIGGGVFIILTSNNIYWTIFGYLALFTGLFFAGYLDFKK